MIDSTQLLEAVIRPVLKSLDLWSEPAERLVLGTACQESECGRWLVQLGGGPALGIFQCEPATHQDIWNHFLKYRKPLAEKVIWWSSWLEQPPPTELVFNLAYATAICRVHYYRDPDPIPDDLHGQARYYKRVYNTPLGKATVEEYLNNWQRFVPQGVL